MGPIDFSKFDNVVKDYSILYDLTELATKINSLKKTHPQFIDYIDLLNTKVKIYEVITANPHELKKLKSKFDRAYKFLNSKCNSPISKNTRCDACSNCLKMKSQESFHNDLSEILDYNSKGKSNLRKVHGAIGMKACYICNAQYSIVAEPENVKPKDRKQKRYSAKFQFDHFLPKSKYPCFSISLYNLYPICSSCNSIKSNNDIGIDFLNTDKKYWLNKFEFKLDETSLSKYLLNNKSELSIDFIDSNIYPNKTSKKIAERFDINGIYNTQKDEIEELIMRKLRYTESYKNALTKSFPNMFKSNSIDERILLGIYSQAEGIHKRPLSKFKQDINAQLDKYFMKLISTRKP